jgi:glutamine amidotransferase
MVSKVTLIDYGIGNLWSVANGFRYLNCDVEIASSINALRSAEIIVLPGVGSFRRGMENLRSKHLDEVILEQVTIKKKKILGICLGMQLMGEYGFEDGETKGLGLIPGNVVQFDNHINPLLRMPHVGFNEVKINTNTNLYKGFGLVADFYFVHSYKMTPPIDISTCGICNYGEDFMASYEHENIFATQFHPEKSQENGLKLLRNFIAT